MRWHPTGRKLLPLLCGLGLVACAPEADPLSVRCIEALSYRSPERGAIEWVERRATPTGTVVTLRYEAGEVDSERAHLHAICEYARDERWNLSRMRIADRELPEAELALVNSELLLRDLSRRPERFGATPDVSSDRPHSR